MASPLEQFTIKPIVSINIGGLNQQTIPVLARAVIEAGV